MPTALPSDAWAVQLRTDAVVADLTGRGALAIIGPDSAELLHGLVTNDVKALRPARADTPCSSRRRGRCARRWPSSDGL